MPDSTITPLTAGLPASGSDTTRSVSSLPLTEADVSFSMVAWTALMLPTEPRGATASAGTSRASILKSSYEVLPKM